MFDDDKPNVTLQDPAAVPWDAVRDLVDARDSTLNAKINGVAGDAARAEGKANAIEDRRRKDKRQTMSTIIGVFVTVIAGVIAYVAQAIFFG